MSFPLVYFKFRTHCGKNVGMAVRDISEVIIKYYQQFKEFDASIKTH